MIDEVALERASRGDRSVWENLTRPERELAMIAARHRRLAELAENDEWSKILRAHSTGRRAGGALPNSHPCPQWLKDISHAAGYKNAETFMRAALRMARAHGEEAA